MFKDPTIRFRPISELGHGGMGRIILAEDKQTGQQVVIKTILANGNDPQTLSTRFAREALILAQLSHPHIVRVLDHGIAQVGQNLEPYIVMEKIHGETLTDYVKNNVVQFETEADYLPLAQLLRQIGTALVHCHEAGIIHRDLKPDNILIESVTQRAVLIDFGVIHLFDYATNGSMTENRLTQTGEVVGSSGFMAPEQILGERSKFGPHTDVWGLGATLYYCLTRRHCYSAASFAMQAKLAVSKDPDSVSDLEEGIPGRLAEYCDFALQREIKNRPSIQQLQEILEGFIVDPLAAKLTRKAKKKWSSPWIVSISALILTILTVLGFALFSQSPPSATLTLDPVSTQQAENNVIISGTVIRTDPDINIFIKTQRKKTRCNVSKDGRFSAEVNLEPGINKIIVKLIHKTSRRTLAIQSLSIDYDLTKPVFLDLPTSITAYDSEVVISGRLNERGHVSCKELELRVQTDSEGRFELRHYSDRRPSRLIIRAEDRVGLKTEARVNVSWFDTLTVDRNRAEGPKNFHDIQSAISMAAGNVIIRLAPGTYQGPVDISKTLILTSAIPEQPAVIHLLKDQQVEIRAPGAALSHLQVTHDKSINSGSQKSSLIYVNSQQVTLTNLEIYGNSNVGVNLAGEPASMKEIKGRVPLKIENCQFNECSQGINASYVHLAVECCQFRNCSRFGFNGLLSVFGEVQCCRFVGCRVGFRAYTASEILVDNCEFENNLSFDLSSAVNSEVVLQNSFLFSPRLTIEQQFQGDRSINVQLSSLTIKNCFVETVQNYCIGTRQASKVYASQTIFLRQRGQLLFRNGNDCTLQLRQCLVNHDIREQPLWRNDKANFTRLKVFLKAGN